MKSFPIIGLMSGTSIDGIDASLIYSNGRKLKRTKFNLTEPYSRNTKNKILKILEKPKSYLKNIKFLKELEKQITIEHAKVSKKIIGISKIKPKLIGLHGQTIYHDGKSKISIQLGDGKLLSDLLKTNVVYQFRKDDLLLGGEGAPIAPIYHKFLIKNLQLTLPSIILNIGGISNFTYWDGKNIFGFDVGPGNNLMDHFMRVKYNKNFDYNGNIAQKGTPDFELVKKYCSEIFFSKRPPKSLERISLIQNKYFKIITQLKPADCLSTLIEITIKSIELGMKFLPRKVKNILIVGGGASNKYLVGKLRDKLNCNVYLPKDFNLNTHYIEAELIGYLAARKTEKLTSTFPSTTGVKKSTILGTLINFKSN